MYHFNGLESAGSSSAPRLARFGMQRRSTADLIGQPVPLDADVGVGYTGTHNCPIEQVHIFRKRIYILHYMSLFSFNGWRRSDFEDPVAGLPAALGGPPAQCGLISYMR
jgi:hypothetical protein